MKVGDGVDMVLRAEFVQYIKDLGFEYQYPSKYMLISYAYNGYEIIMTCDRYSIKYGGEYYKLNETNQRNFSKDYLFPLEDLFKSEIRDNKLNIIIG